MNTDVLALPSGKTSGGKLNCPSFIMIHKFLQL